MPNVLKRSATQGSGVTQTTFSGRNQADFVQNINKVVNCKIKENSSQQVLRLGGRSSLLTIARNMVCTRLTLLPTRQYQIRSGHSTTSGLHLYQVVRSTRFEVATALQVAFIYIRWYACHVQTCSITPPKVKQQSIYGKYKLCTQEHMKNAL